MKYNIKTIMYGCLMIAATMFTACDEHRDFLDTGMKVGHVLCTDGVVMSYPQYEVSDKEAIGVIFYTNENTEIEGEGYAVYLNDLYPEMFADSIGVAQKTSADLSAFDGNENTFSMFSSSGMGSPLANSVFALWRYGQSAYIPSVAQMRLLHASKEFVNQIIEKCGGEPLPDEAGECWYWTSTEVDGQETAKAWLYSMGSGSLQETPKDQAHKSRPIITINR